MAMAATARAPGSLLSRLALAAGTRNPNRVSMLSAMAMAMRMKSGELEGAVAAAGRVEMEVETPLFLRRERHQVPLRELVSWREEARERIAALGSSLAEADGGPDGTELRAELDWLLDDAVRGMVGGTGEEECSWREVRGRREEEGARVVMRASLRELQDGWRRRVEERVPFQYLVGCAHWRELVLAVQPGVLIPRPETEMLVELAGAAMDASPGLRHGVWVDLGTGSGAIAIALQRLLRPPGCVIAVDASPVAVAVAKANVARCSLQGMGMVDVQQGSWFSAPGPMHNLAGVVSNPPYIPSPHLEGLQAEVGKHEPRSALDGGEDGMHHLRTICDGAGAALGPGGFLALETNGDQQSQELAQLLAHGSSFFRQVEIEKDFAGIGRFVTAVHV